ncbi:hypothetical protein QR680_016762 [Steinernema hermaphroditum]|uniref:mTERF domain-containing protein 1, mitochondrial n=1 Tax=Steinernema hermaphroditum TaxID=289476 RepID=A0AA39HC85_9BILA|nr:hypothetical protein QR680_016762 [Steinernema hermaphroditum]
MKRAVSLVGRRLYTTLTETSSNTKAPAAASKSDYELLEERKMKSDVISTVLKNRKLVSRDFNDVINEIASTGLVRDKTMKTDLSEMESEDTDYGVRPVNRFRKIVYSEGELDNTDLSLPPSPENPHPFDPEKHPLPPTHGMSLAAYVNHLPTLQNLVDLGVNLLQVDTETALGRHLVRMDWDRDVMPKLQWLNKSVGVKPDVMGSYLTRNPYFLIQDLKDLQTRVNYLQTKMFNKKEITKICTENRYWLNMDVKTVDARLGWLQEQFSMRAKEVRALIAKEPRVIQYGLGPLQRVTMLFNKELQFSPYELKLMLMRDPRLWMSDPTQILRSYKYLTGKMEITHEQLVKFPLALRCLLSTIRLRHEFLVRVKRAQYVEGVADCVSLPLFFHQSDKVFAEKAGRCELHIYDEFVRRR